MSRRISSIVLVAAGCESLLTGTLNDPQADGIRIHYLQTHVEESLTHEDIGAGCVATGVDGRAIVETLTIFQDNSAAFFCKFCASGYFKAG